MKQESLVIICQLRMVNNASEISTHCPSHSGS